MKYQATGRGKKSGGNFYWLLVIFALAFLGWIWWKTGRTTNSPSLRPASPIPRTNLPPKIGSAPKTLSLPPASNPPPVIIIRTTAPPSQITSNNLTREFATNVSLFSQKMLEMQIALVRRGISPGPLDGVPGHQTRAALRAFQNLEGLPASGELDAATQLRLTSDTPPYVDYLITSDDRARLRPLSKTWLGKSQQDRLDYETILELVAEKGQAHPNLIRRLNPHLGWTNVVAGTVVKIPNVEFPLVRRKAASVRILLASRILRTFDEEGRLLAQFPCSIAQRMEKRPVGELRVAVTARDPNYTFNPEIFPESGEGRRLGRKLILQPGPNNPVGTVWIGLDRPGYGIHGTPRPEEVGRTESHGCFRLANWNAEYLFRLVTIGTPVLVEP